MLHVCCDHKTCVGLDKCEIVEEGGKLVQSSEQLGRKVKIKTKTQPNKTDFHFLVWPGHL